MPNVEIEPGLFAHVEAEAPPARAKSVVLRLIEGAHELEIQYETGTVRVVADFALVIGQAVTPAEGRKELGQPAPA